MMGIAPKEWQVSPINGWNCNLGSLEQHIWGDGTLFGVRGASPEEMLFQNQREGTVSAEMDSELSGTWLGSEKLARKHGLVLNEGGVCG